MRRLQHTHTYAKSHSSGGLWGDWVWGLGYRAGRRKKSRGQTEGRDPGAISQAPAVLMLPYFGKGT